MSAPVLPKEYRDPEGQAMVFYSTPLRRDNHKLVQENWRLKKLLRKHGIPWSRVSREHMIEECHGKVASTGMRLPMEILLRILKYTMTSSYPIVDPLSPLALENLSDLEIARGNNIGIHFLATCSTMYKEGTMYLWQLNNFEFTSPAALRRFGDLSSHFRHLITNITLRIVAQYFDDQSRPHTLEAEYHDNLEDDQPLKVYRRPQVSPLVQGGFRCYTWSHVVDFLAALRAPYNPMHLDDRTPRRPMFPNLTTLRLDLVNFSTDLVPFPSSELHHIASHEFGCTLNELQVTGLPFDDTGEKAAIELSGMLKDEGLYLVGQPSYIARQDYLQTLPGGAWYARVVRAWMPDAGQDIDPDHIDYDFDNPFSGLLRPKMGVLPEAPAEKCSPPSTCLEGTTIWKQVPVGRDCDERVWREFVRASGSAL